MALRCVASRLLLASRGGSLSLRVLSCPLTRAFTSSSDEPTLITPPTAVTTDGSSLDEGPVSDMPPHQKGPFRVSAASVGVSAMAVYLPMLRVRLEEWCKWTGNSWDKVQQVVGSSFRMPACHEDIYTMAANAVVRLILQNDIDVSEIGFLGFGTESSRDNATGAIIVAGMVNKALQTLHRPTLPRSVEVPEFKHACLGGIYALKAGCRFVLTDRRHRKALVVCGDIAD
eukprot:RCo014679